MKNFKLPFYYTIVSLLFLFSCQKNSIIDAPVVKPNNTFGVLINSSENTEIPISKKISLLKDDFKVPYTRVQIAIPNWNGSITIYDQFTNSGLKVLLNVTSKTTNEIEPPGPFITDTVLYRQKIIEILNKYKPEVLVIENEETNEGYYTGTAQDYINLLGIAIDEGHKRNIKVTNGGFPSRMSTLLCWDYYQSIGQTTKAADYALRTFPASISANLPAYISSNIPAQQQLAKGKILLTAYKNLTLDYVNFHWYELITQRELSAQTSTLPALAHVDIKAFEETANFFTTATGKIAITNEIGQINKVGSLLTDVVQKCFEIKMPYVIWYSGDGGAGKATALYDQNGTLRDNGKAFQTFITSKY